MYFSPQGVQNIMTIWYYGAYLFLNFVQWKNISIEGMCLPEWRWAASYRKSRSRAGPGEL